MEVTTAVDARLVDLVRAYSARVRDAVLEQHPQASITSPLGIWVLLCACLIGAEEPERARLEAAVGCSRDEAGELLEAFVANVPEAVQAALALWVQPQAITDAFEQWATQLPEAVAVGPTPTQAEADAWVDRNTLGLIKRLPLDVRETLVMLASAVATRVSWEKPFEIAPTADRFSSSSPWINVVDRVLLSESPLDAAIIDSASAGPVAVYEAAAREDLTVVCVSAEPSVDRRDVMSAAHEVAAQFAAGEPLAGRSLFDLPLGDGHSWTIAEQDRPAYRAGLRYERFEAALPAWEIESTLDLLVSDAFAAGVATDVLMQKVGPGPGGAQQAAVATFDRSGFKAAAVTVMVVATSGAGTPPMTGIERTAKLRFDHPFAAIALAGRPRDSGGRFRGLPVFEAWIDTPTEVDPTNRAPG